MHPIHMCVFVYTCMHTAIIDNWSLFERAKSVSLKEQLCHVELVSHATFALLYCTIGETRKFWQSGWIVCVKWEMYRTSCAWSTILLMLKTFLALTVTQWRVILRNRWIIATVICMLTLFVISQKKFGSTDFVVFHHLVGVLCDLLRNTWILPWFAPIL